MGSSFARTDAQKKQHKERAQPFNRQRYGLLEKKKDYVLRATDYKQKQARLKTLRSKAANKNEDEFYFGMINRTTKNGVAVKDRGNSALSQDVTKVLKTQDGNYIKTMAAIERQKVAQLKAARHIPRPLEDEEEEQGKRHVVYVDTAEDLSSLDPVTRLNTTQENLARTENRLPQGAAKPSMDPAARLLRRKMRAEKGRAERELQVRKKRLQKLRVMERETEVQRQLQGKGARRKVGVDADGVAKYKWKQERKR